MDSKALAKQTPSPAAVASRLAASLLHFASGLESSLSSNKEVDSSDLAHYTTKANDSTKIPPGDLSQRLECTARRIWNACLRKQNNVINTDESSKTGSLWFYTRVRLFAYLLLGLCTPANDVNGADSTAYLIRLGLTLSKVCINTADLDSARISLQKVTEYLERDTRRTSTTTTTTTTTAKHGVTETDNSHEQYASYYILRIALSWKDDRLDLAEHMYTKATHHIPFLHDTLTTTTTTLVQLLTQIGHSLITQSSNYAAALPWFRRAIAESSPSPTSSHSRDPAAAAASEAQQQEHERSRLSATRGVLQCLTAAGLVDEAGSLVAAAQSEFRGRSFEILEMAGMLHMAMGDFGGLAATLIDIVHDANNLGELRSHSSASSLEFVLECVEKMGRHDGEKAADVLDQLLPQQVCRPGIVLDKAVVLRVQLLLQVNDVEVIWDLFDLFDCVRFYINGLGEDAVQQLHLILWKIIQPLYHDKKYTQVLSWCHLALHSVLSPATTTTATNLDNHDKIARKMLSCHIQLTSYTEALTLFQNLPQPTQDHLITRFLLFRLAIRCWNQTLAAECIHFFATLPYKNESRDALYACIREAQSSGDKLCTAEALEAVVVTWQGEGSVSGNLPSVLRCAARLHQLVATENSTDAAELSNAVEERFRVAIVHLFKLASEFVSKNVHDETGAIVFNTAELHWLYTNSYNLGVLHCTSWDPGCLVSLFKSCLIFTQALLLLIPSNHPTTSISTDTVDAILTSLRCHFILASFCISEAQTNQTEHTSSLYADVEHHATAFKSQFEQLCSNTNNIDTATTTATAAATQYPDLLQKYVTSAILKRIINEIFPLENFNSDKLAQYLRCMVQVLLPTSNDDFALQILDQAIQVANEAKQVGVAFPAEEAEWLAATTFNHGLTKYAAKGNMNICHAWLDKAVSIARHADEDGTLFSELQDRQARLADTLRAGTV